MSATRSGILILIVVVILAAAGMFFVLSMMLTGTSAPKTPSSTIVVWDVPYSLPEIEPPARTFPFYVSGYTPRRPTVFSMSSAIRRAAYDDRVRGLVLHIGFTSWGWATVAEVRDAIVAFRETGKPVYATLEWGGEREYLLATAADVIAVPPTVPVQLDGLAAGAMFFKGTFDKIGINANFERIGEYKSAVEQYSRKDLSPEAREMLEATIDDMYATFLESAGAARGMEVEEMKRRVEGGPYSAAEARDLGLIDSLLHVVELDSLATRRGGKRLEITDLKSYERGLGPRRSAADVALVVASGTIAPGKSQVAPYQGSLVGSETLIEALRDAREDDGIDAIVLRIDSPGGSAQASDDILQELNRCRAVKPLIVSMSDLAASGGYYIALAGDSIVSHASTQTGSIGIYGGKFNLRGLYEKLGITVDLVTRGPNATILSPWSDWSEEERAQYRKQLSSFYERFVALTAERRGMSFEEADALARGRVWTGRRAVENGLVDEIGTLQTAFRMAKSMIGVDPDELVAVHRFPRRETTFLGSLLEELFHEEDTRSQELIELPPFVQSWIAAARLPAGSFIALMPWSVDAR